MSPKATKYEVQYGLATTDRTCDNCRYMNSDGTCQKVRGYVQPEDVCIKWELEA